MNNLSYINNLYEKKIKLEVLQSEKLRSFVLGGVLFLFAIVIIINISFFNNKFIEKLPELITALEWITLLFMFIALRSFYVGKIYKKQLLKSKELPYSLRYINAFFEVSFLSLSLLILSIYIEPNEALNSPLILLYFPLIVLSSLELDNNISYFTGTVAAIEYLLLSIYYTNSTTLSTIDIAQNLNLIHVSKALILFISGILAGIVSMQIKKKMLTAIDLLQQRNEIEKLFGQQVSKEIVDEVLENNLNILSKSRDVSVMFLDIRNFSNFCEGKPPTYINEYLNSTLGFMIEIINKHNGIVNQILGDGFMAVFGAPIENITHCQNAVDAAMEIYKELESMNKMKKLSTYTQIGIGIHSGIVVTGNIGTEARKQYSIIGNVVILASRIEQLNKKFNSTLLVSKEVFNKISIKIKKVQFLGDIILKGRTKPIQLYKLI